MSAKISLEELEQMASDPEVPESKLRGYFSASFAAPRPFAPSFGPNPQTVTIDPEVARLEGAMDFANRWCRRRRKRRFDRRIRRGDERPVLVSEGDSWFQFPFLIDDVIDHLYEDYTVRSLGAAGDTAANIVRSSEYLTVLREQAERVQAFLLSAAGNDVLGDIDGVPQIKRLLKHRSGTEPAQQLVNWQVLKTTLDSLRAAYQEIVTSIRSVRGFESLPVVIHGYDYPFPGKMGDPRDPVWAAPDQWLGRPLSELNIRQPSTQRAVLKILLDELYGMLGELSDADPHVHLVDLRGSLPDRSDWADEIHATDQGFKEVAARFGQVIESARALRGGSSSPAAFEAASGLAGSSQAEESRSAVVVIDPGHGGSTAIGGSSPNNAIGPNGTLEKELTLDLALRMRDLLLGRGHNVIMTRETDVNLGLVARAEAAKNLRAEVFVSIHFNGFSNPAVQGTETFHHETFMPKSRALAEQLHARLVQATRLSNRGVKQGRFAVVNPINHAANTAACLTEVSFLTDPLEERRLQDPVYKNRIARALADGVEDYLEEASRARRETADLEADSTYQEVGDSTEQSDRFNKDIEGVDLLQDPGSLDASEASILPMSGIERGTKFLGAWRRLRQESAGLDVQFEAIVGRDNSLPVRFLELGSDRSKAVCKIVTSGINHLGQRGGSWSGTGFLVAPDLLLTNHHVLNSREVASRARVLFDYRHDHEGLPTPAVEYSLDPDALFVTSPAKNGLDYTFVRIKGAPQDRFGHIPMQRAAFAAAPAERANVIHHPGGSPKRVSLQDNQVLEFDPLLLHYASDTEGGSSGAPVFDNTWRLIALHHASRQLPEGRISPDGSNSRVVNEGIKISAIAVDLDRRMVSHIDGGAERAVLESISGSDSLTGYFGGSGRSSDAGNGLEAVVDVYRGSDQDIDVGFWNLLWFNKHYRDRQAQVARVIADLNLDIWAFSETSPEATRALVDHLAEEFGQKFQWAASEPEASSGKQTTTVIWNPLTVTGRRLDWPDEIEPLLRADSRRVPDLRFEAVEGRVFNRYPGLFRFEAKHRPGNGREPFNFNLVPLHLKAKGEGAKRRRLASEILAAVVRRMIDYHGADRDWVIGGDVNAELVTGQFQALTKAGFLPMSAEDEGAGAISYIKGPKSLIDTIFLSPNLARRYGADDFFIYAGDRAVPNYLQKLSDHRPVLARLSLMDHVAESQPMSAAGDLVDLGAVMGWKGHSRSGSNEVRSVGELVDEFVERAKQDPEKLARSFAQRLKEST